MSSRTVHVFKSCSYLQGLFYIKSLVKLNFLLCHSRIQRYFIMVIWMPSNQPLLLRLPTNQSQKKLYYCCCSYPNSELKTKMSLKVFFSVVTASEHTQKISVASSHSFLDSFAAATLVTNPKIRVNNQH